MSPYQFWRRPTVMISARPIILMALTSLVLFPVTARACNVPVFRYAIERWPADDYEFLIYHRGALTDEEKAALNLLTGDGKTALEANIEVHRIDVATELDAEAMAAWTEAKERGASEEYPQIVVRYPRRARTPWKHVWAGKLNRENASRLLDSPLRAEIAKRLVGGHSGVWIFVESGDAKADAAAKKKLDAAVATLGDKLELPEITESDLELAGLTKEDEASISVRFSSVTLSRSDPKERPLLEMLLGTEPDLVPAKGEPLLPMAFPVFGRGRALYALIGGGINEDTILDAGAFLVGPCSCQVKDQNPGVDLLISVAWDDLVTSSSVKDVELPELAGIGELSIESSSTIEDVEIPESTRIETPVTAFNADGDQGESGRSESNGLPISGEITRSEPVAQDNSAVSPDAVAKATKLVPPVSDAQAIPEAGDATPQQAIEGSASSEATQAPEATSEMSAILRNSLIALALGVFAVAAATILLRPKTS